MKFIDLIKRITGGKQGDEGQKRLVPKAGAISAPGRPFDSAQGLRPAIDSLSCPYCFSKNFQKRGLRAKKLEKVQLYLCKDCGKTFTPQITKGKHYPLAVMLDALSVYNLGYSLEETCRITNQRMTTKKSAFADLVRLIDLRIDWPDNLKHRLSFVSALVNTQNELGVDPPGVKPGRLGLSDQSSKSAEPTPISNIAYEYDEVRIDQVEIGDEILSLNEQTGELEYQVVEAIKNNGIKEVYKIETESGKTIRATADHPFLVDDKWLEVKDLKIGRRIATLDGFEKITSIKKDKKERVWDIQVSQNHNFIGNGLVAHNCLLAAATDTGVTKISNIMSSDTSYDYSDNASDDYGHVVLAETAGGSGDLYADNDTTDALERWNNVLDDSASETAGTPDTTYDEASTPAIFVTAATEINDLKITPQASTVESVSPAIYLAHNLGITVLNEKRSDPTNGSVKYLTKDYISEELIGDTNGFWPLNETSGTRTDQSVKTNDLTDNNTVTYASGVRGTAAQFTAANSEYLSIADNATLSTGDIDFTIAAWVYLDTSSTHAVISKATAVDASFEYGLWVGPTDVAKLRVGNGVTTTDSGATAALSIGAWHYLVAWHDSVNNQLGIQLDNGTPVTTSYTTGVIDGTQPFQIGHGNGWINYYNGRIDEVLFTKEVLTAAQRTQLYVSGKEALNNKYRVKLASDTVNELAGDDNTVKAVAVAKLNQTGVTRGEYLYVGTNGTSADDGILSRVLVNGDTRDREYDESTKEPYLLTDNDINSVSISNDGAYIVVGTDDAGVTIIQNGSNAVRLRGGSKIQGPYKRPHN